MSRQSHVHDEELVEDIEQRREEHERRRRGRGCASCLLTLVVFTALAIGAIFSSLGWIEAHLPKEFKPLVDIMRAQTQPPSAVTKVPGEKTPSPDLNVRAMDWLGNLREQAAALQKNIDELQKSGALEEQLKGLREQLLQREDVAQKLTKQEMQDLTKLMDNLVTSAKKDATAVQSVDFNQMKNQLNTLMKLLPKKTDTDKVLVEQPTVATPTPKK
ncbi:TPA: hypothetical protein DDW35_06820 [Candidatus Sumerlaeota bacterium]|jgi:hypothetical protein|nr:hypothetical protein [Candidatus Sumerlaeota bacterium]